MQAQYDGEATEIMWKMGGPGIRPQISVEKCTKNTSSFGSIFLISYLL